MVIRAFEFVVGGFQLAALKAVEFLEARHGVLEFLLRVLLFVLQRDHRFLEQLAFLVAEDFFKRGVVNRLTGGAEGKQGEEGEGGSFMARK